MASPSCRLGPLALAASCAAALGCSDGGAASPTFDAGPARTLDATFEAAPAEAATGDDASDGCVSAFTDAGCAPFHSCADLAAPVVTFAANIAPVLNASCGIGGSTCHGDPSITPYFDVATGGAAKVLSTVVGVASPEDPSVVIAAPGHPESSMLMQKLDGDQCLYVAACDARWDAASVFHACGQRMPINGAQLDEATRDLFRRWIAQGAKND